LQGDALWIEYGTPEDTRRILIDGGPIGAYNAVEEKLKKLPDGDKGVELVVISHVDTDHIEGIIRLMATQRGQWPFSPKDIWFNGWDHLVQTGVLGGREGDFLSALISKRASDVWNKAFDGKVIAVQPDQQPPTKELSGGMKITLLSPSPEKLKAMGTKWRKDVEKYQLEPGDLDAAWEQLVDMKKYKVAKGVLGGTDELTKTLTKQLKTDQSAANGTSIALLAEYAGKSCLFLADAQWNVVCDSIKKIIPSGQERLKVDAVKVSHHGSKNNMSKKLMDLIDAKHFLVSTDGSMGHNHPDKPAIQAILQWSVRKPTLWFNYKSKYNAVWAKTPKKGGRDYTACYPFEGSVGIAVEI
jgi:hypothetical protein